MENLNREAWLGRLADLMLPHLASLGIEMPEETKLRFSCGWPSSGSRSSTIGECWRPVASKDGTTELFISPAIEDAERVADILAHELIHASGLHDHRADFAKAAKSIGLEGKPTATIGGEEFLAWAAPMIEELGPYPHAELGFTPEKWRKLKPGELPPWGGKPKQGTRLLKVMCDEGHDPYIARMTRKALDFGYPTCPCGREMIENA